MIWIRCVISNITLTCKTYEETTLHCLTIKKKQNYPTSWPFIMILLKLSHTFYLNKVQVCDISDITLTCFRSQFFITLTVLSIILCLIDRCLIFHRLCKCSNCVCNLKKKKLYSVFFKQICQSLPLLPMRKFIFKWFFFIFHVQWNLSKQHLFGTSFYMRNRQVSRLPTLELDF